MIGMNDNTDFVFEFRAQTHFVPFFISVTELETWTENICRANQASPVTGFLHKGR